MFKLCVVVLALVAAAAALQPLGATLRRTPDEWTRSSKVLSGDEPVTVHMAVKNTNLDVLLSALNAVSDPASPAYGRHWTRKQLCDTIAPLPEHVNAVRQFAADNGLKISHESNCLDKIAITAPASAIAAAFQIALARYESTIDSEVTIIRTETALLVPDDVAAAVDAVYGIQEWPVLRVNLAGKSTLGAAVNPTNLRTLYGINESATTGKSTQGCAEFQGQAYSASDLVKFQKDYNLPAQAVVNNTGAAAGGAHAEANLDVQYIMVTGQLAPTDMYLQGLNTFDLMKWITDVQDSASPYIWSVSYGEDISAVTADYAQRLDVEFQKVGVLGISILFASGDSGVYSRTGGTRVFHPDYPASLPHVTGVGATELNADSSETTAASFSGGGFGPSNYFAREVNCTYQDQAVSNFFTNSTDLPPAEKYDNKGCGYPDVSALGVDFEVVIDGIKEGVSGTSCSCPTVAGVFALVNDQRIAAGKSPLGFLNPFIYANPAGFHDITQGKNANGHIYGFTAIAGWDPVTGMGTPNYPALKAAALALQ